MTLEFKQTAPGVFTASTINEKSGRHQNIAIIESCGAWHLFVDSELKRGDLPSFSAAIDAVDAAIKPARSSAMVRTAAILVVLSVTGASAIGATKLISGVVETAGAAAPVSATVKQFRAVTPVSAPIAQAAATTRTPAEPTQPPAGDEPPRAQERTDAAGAANVALPPEAAPPSPYSASNSLLGRTIEAQDQAQRRNIPPARPAAPQAERITASPQPPGAAAVRPPRVLPMVAPDAGTPDGGADLPPAGNVVPETVAQTSPALVIGSPPQRALPPIPDQAPKSSRRLAPVTSNDVVARRPQRRPRTTTTEASPARTERERIVPPVRKRLPTSARQHTARQFDRDRWHQRGMHDDDGAPRHRSVSSRPVYQAQRMVCIAHSCRFR